MARTFSIYGDSVSTLQGFLPEYYLPYYSGGIRRRSGVETMEDTWWGMVIRHFNGKLLTNNSYSGSMISCPRLLDGRLFPSACSKERILALTDAGEPDVLLVFMGMNDWDAFVPLKSREGAPWNMSFYAAYDYTLSQIRHAFPQTEIWCMSLMYSAKMQDEFGMDRIREMKDYNRCIQEAADKWNGHMIDLYTTVAGYTAYDTAHPDKAGMRKIADVVISAMENTAGMITSSCPE